MKAAAILVVAVLAIGAVVDAGKPEQPGQPGRPPKPGNPGKPGKGPSRKCGLACAVCDQSNKKCVQCKGPEHVLKPGRSGQCMCAAGYGSYYSQTNGTLQPSKAPNCGNVNKSLTGKPPAQGPCVCFKCQDGYTTAVPQMIQAAMCMPNNTQPTAVNCTGSWTEGTCVYEDPCSAGNRIDTYHVTTPASNGGAECLAQDNATRTVVCNSELKDKDACGEANVGNRCLNGTCTAPVNCTVTYRLDDNNPCTAQCIGGTGQAGQVVDSVSGGNALGVCPEVGDIGPSVSCMGNLANGTVCSLGNSSGFCTNGECV